jgi:hypothetical protein
MPFNNNDIKRSIKIAAQPIELLLELEKKNGTTSVRMSGRTGHPDTHAYSRFPCRFAHPHEARVSPSVTSREREGGGGGCATGTGGGRDTDTRQ